MTIEDGRRALRLSNSKSDNEIGLLIDAAKIDLETAGVYEPAEIDPLYETAVINYLRGYFSVESPISEKCREIYANIKSDMKLAGRCSGNE